MPSPENRKFNLIVSGVPEAPEGQARLSRVNHDFERVSSIFSWIPQMVLLFESETAVVWADSRAAQRIPALVLFWSPWIRCLPWTSRSVRIRRYLSPKARSARSLLLKEWQNLIESGVEHSDIALRRMSLLVKGRVYGTICGDTFQLAGASTSPL